MSNKIKRIMSFVLAAAMVFSLLGIQPPEAAAEDSCGYTPAMTMTELYQSGGSASDGECYSISSEDELMLFAEYVNAGGSTAGATFYLTQDIKLDKDTVWEPVGSSYVNSFGGVFDGCGFAVLNLVNSAAGNDFALFSNVSGSAALIKNLGVEGEVAGGTGLAGIVVSLSAGAVKNCWSAVDISGNECVGGIAAEVIGGNIENCLNYGYISGSTSIGAIAGALDKSTAVSDCYYVYYSADKAVGTVASGGSPCVYRFASSSTEALTEKVLTVGKEKTDDLIALLNAWIERSGSVAEYRTWVYDTSSKAVSRVDGRYPSMEYPGYITPVDSIYTATASMTALYESNKNGIAGGYYSISSGDELLYLQKYVNSGYATEGMTFYLTADISMTPISAMTVDQTWIPIGNSEKTPFRGVFDGQGYFLSDNYITSGNVQGLFGYVDSADAEIKNVAANGIIVANDDVGGIVGYLVSGNVVNCWFAGEINADNRVGAIVGRADAGTITNCVAFNEINANSKSGAIVGKTSSSVSLKYCYYPTDSKVACGDSSCTQTAVVAFTNGENGFKLERSVTVGSASGIMLLNVLNHWVTYLSTDDSYRPWKYDSSAAGIARIQGDHPTQLFPGDGSGIKQVDEPRVDVDDTKNPYGVKYTETATMTELYESGEAAIVGGHYSISTAKELSLLAEFVNSGNDTDGVIFYLTDDLDISVYDLGNDGHGWQPIGKDYSGTDLITLTYTFRGIFDGCGYTVYGMFITNEKGDNVGLFGRVRGGTIKNLGVVGAMVGEWNCGGIVGKIDDGLIENCWAAVSIQSESETGGIAGRIDHTTIKNCVSYGGLLCYGGETCVAGGIFGDDMGKSTIENCYYLKDTTSEPYNSLAGSSTADIVPFTYGFENDDYYCTLERAVVIDDVTTSSLLDALNAWVKVRNSVQFSGWYNSSVIIAAGDGTNPGHYPRLMPPQYDEGGKNEDYDGDYSETSSVSSLYASQSDGIEGACYSINNLDDLEALRSYTADGYKTKNIIFFMTRDVDMSTKYSSGTGRSWTPIGSVGEPFSGTFDGQGYTVKFLYINTSGDDVGLFGHVNNGAVIKNLGVSGIVRGSTNAGGIVGDFNFSTLANCWASCEVTALSNNAGGLVGGANMGTIVNCTSYGAVVNAAQYGAIAGYAFGTTIKYCYYLYGTCQQAYGVASTPVVSGVQYFNGTSAACILHEKVNVEGTSTRNALSALKLYVDAHPETNYCYWDVGNTEEYLAMGVAYFPVLISASNTMGENDYRKVQAYFDGREYYSIVKAVKAANEAENGGEITLALNAVLSRNENITLDEDVRILTGDYSLVIKSDVNVFSMQQLDGMYIVKEGGSVCLWDTDGYRRFIHSNKDADASCASEIYGTQSLTFLSSSVEGAGSDAYSLHLQDGEFIVNSALDSGNPHKIPGGSTLTVGERATFNVSANARIRTTGGAEIINNGTVKIGNVTLDCNGGKLMKGVFEDDGGVVSLPFVYKDGYMFSGWTDGADTYAGGSTVTAEKAVTLTAKWKLGYGTDPYPGDDAYSDSDEPVYNIPINVIQAGGGKISPDSMKAAKGENLTFSISPDTEYYLKNLLVDKEAAEHDAGDYTFVSISREHDITALFALVTNSAYYDWFSTFTDVRGDQWFYNYVGYCVSAGMFNGVTETTFCPDDNMTREMLITVLWRLSGSPVVPGGELKFTDVPKDNYSYEAIRWGCYYGIVNGISQTEFGFEDDITREQLVTFLFRYAKNYAGDDVSLYDSTNILGYSDVLEISKGMTQPFQWAIGAGIVNGATENTLDPKGNASRAMVAAVLSRYCNKFINLVPVFDA